MNPNPSVSDKVVQKIIDRLARRELKPGDKLPSEAVMAAELGVSRIALREGLKALAAKGLIVTRHGEGSFINQYSPKLLSDTLFNLSLLNDGPLLEILQLRKLIETEAARLCASNATAEELAEIVLYKDKREQYCKVEQTDDAIAKKYEYDRLFHQAIAKGSHVQLYRQFLETIQTSLSIHQSFSSSSETMASTSHFHAEITNALINRDPETAASMMYAHLSQIEEAMGRKNSIGQTGT